MIQKFKQITKELIILGTICTASSVMVYLFMYFNFISGAEPPIVSKENQQKFQNEYVIRYTDDVYGGNWYKITKLPVELVGTWKYDDQIMNMYFSDITQTDINNVRADHYQWNLRETNRRIAKSIIWIWIIGVVMFVLLKIKAKISDWLTETQYQ